MLKGIVSQKEEFNFPSDEELFFIYKKSNSLQIVSSENWETRCGPFFSPFFPLIKYELSKSFPKLSNSAKLRN